MCDMCDMCDVCDMCDMWGRVTTMHATGGGMHNTGATCMIRVRHVVGHAQYGRDMYDTGATYGACMIRVCHVGHVQQQK